MRRGPSFLTEVAFFTLTVKIGQRVKMSSLRTLSDRRTLVRLTRSVEATGDPLFAFALRGLALQFGEPSDPGLPEGLERGIRRRRLCLERCAQFLVVVLTRDPCGRGPSSAGHRPGLHRGASTSGPRRSPLLRRCHPGCRSSAPRGPGRSSPRQPPGGRRPNRARRPIGAARPVRASQERCAAAGRRDWRGAWRTGPDRGRSPAAIVVHRQPPGRASRRRRAQDHSSQERSGAAPGGSCRDRRAARRGTQPSTRHIGRGIGSAGCPRPRPGGRGRRPRAPPTRGV